MPYLDQAGSAIVNIADAVGNYDALARHQITDSSGSSLIGFIQSGVNAVATTLQARGRNIIYATSDYGAVGDNSTDCLAAITAAANDIHTVGHGTLIFPPGNYLFKYTAAQPAIRLYSNTHIHLEEGATLYSQGIFPGINSALFYAASGASNISITGPGAIKAAAGVAITGNTTNTSTIISAIADTSSIVVNMPVEGSGIPEGSYVVSKTASTIVISNACTATASAIAITCHYTGGPFIAMDGVDRFYMGGNLKLLDVYGDSAHYAVRTLLAISNFIIDGVHLGYDTKTGGTGQYYSGEDGIHILSPSSHGTISNITGTSGDDFVAINVEDFSQTGWDSAISDINVSNIDGKSNWAQVIRLYIKATATVGTIKRIKYSNINGTSNDKAGNSGSVGVYIGDLSLRKAISGIDIVNATIDCTNNGDAGMTISYATDVTVRSFEAIAPNNQAVNAGHADNILLDDIKSLTANGTANAGIYAATCTDFTIRNGQIANQLSHGIHFSDVTRGLIDGVKLDTNTGNGIALAGTTSHVRVTKNYLIGNSGQAIQEYNTADYNTIVTNDVGAGGITALGVHTYVGLDNTGYAPSTAAVTVTASPFTHAAGNLPETIYIKGGTVSDVSVDGNTLFTATGCTVKLNPNQGVVVTYSVAPTMVKTFN